MIIDAHVHIFPDKIAETASKGISDFYDITVQYDGKLSTLLEIGDHAGVDKFVVQSPATVPQQVESINNFIYQSVQEHPDRLIGFMTLHPDYEDIDAEVTRAIAMGLKGVKLHPDFQKFNIDDPKAFCIYESIQGRLPLLVHMGDFRYEYSKPSRMAKVMELFPKLDVIGAHFGGWSEWSNAAEVFQGKRLWVDTSSTMYELPPEKIRELISLYGVDKVLFGTDYPMWDAKDELELLSCIGLSSEDLERILHANIEELLNLE